MTTYCLNQAGLVLQLGAAAYLVFVSFASHRTFSRFKTGVTYDGLGPLLDELVKAQRTQFLHQLAAFVA